MDEFVSKFESNPLFNHLKTIVSLCEDISNDSPVTLKELLKFLVRKYHLTDKNTGVNADTQTDLNECTTSDWNSINITDDVAAVAKKNLEDNGFVYDETTGLYYDHRFNCYYNPELKLYYYDQTKAYYYYNEETQDLQFYCAASSELKDSNAGSIQEDLVQQDTDVCTEDNINCNSPTNTVLGKNEESSGISEEPRLSPGPVVIEAGPRAFQPDHSKHIAPCMRAIVASSTDSQLDPGTLFIVTCTGGTLGREGDHDILIPEKLVSKHHASFKYVYKDGEYVFQITDVGSKNGTYISGKRLSDSLVESEPVVVTHGSVIKVGTTELLFHIHPKDDICSECEAYNVTQEKIADLSREKSLKEKHIQELTTIKKKFMIKNSPPKYPLGYEDRSENRRKLKGSSHPAEKTESASTEVAIDNRNKGFSLMSKMGWVEGTSLGKQDGIVEPLVVKKQEGRRGLGCEESFANLLHAAEESKKISHAKKTMERYELSLNEQSD